MRIKEKIFLGKRKRRPTQRSPFLFLLLRRMKPAKKREKETNSSTCVFLCRHRSFYALSSFFSLPSNSFSQRAACLHLGNLIHQKARRERDPPPSRENNLKIRPRRKGKKKETDREPSHQVFFLSSSEISETRKERNKQALPTACREEKRIPKEKL